MIDTSQESVWLFWMKETFMPLIEQTGLTLNCRLFCLQKLEEDHDNTFALQIEFASMVKMEQYNDLYKVKFDTLMIKRFGTAFTAFRTVLHEV